MKLSETKNISELLKKIGIHEDPKNMSPEDIEKLAKRHPNGFSGYGIRE